ncbi:MAG TPA: HlyD family efflux transporter periplasmic adaptor subunit, partial [bacterium]|nr:HlyD family efflux transporter periplasmic adaptor subunit [bacterium]
LATPVLAPIDGVVIVRSVEPGQTVVTGDAVLVLSDRLIVKAQIDEVDLGRIALGQTAQIRLDAYPQNVTAALVDHISFESTVVNNVTIYEVDVLPQEIPAVFRSGMSATVDFFEKNNDHALLIPHSAVISQSGEDFVLVLNAQTAKQEQRKISLGLTDGENVEVTQGLTEGDVVLLQNKDGVLSQKKSTGKNPFMPNFEKKK